jgi:hypothetical protein
MRFSHYDTPAMIDAYRRLLRTVGDMSSIADDARLTSHWPVVGGSYEQDLLVVGQAVFGWVPDWHLPDLRRGGGEDRILEATRLPMNDRADPMSWIAGSPNRTSPFWRTVKLVVQDRSHDSPGIPWYSQIAWTNLYPIALKEPPGNPTGELRDGQTRAGADFLLSTVDALRPRVVLVVAGPFWWPFQDLIGLDEVSEMPRPLMQRGSRGLSQWIIGWHPAGATRRRWGPAAYAEAILRIVDTPMAGNQPSRT